MRAPVVYLAILAISSQAHGARILGLFPHTGRSHQMVFEPLLQKLTERGHHITSVSFFPLKNPPANYTDVSLEGIAELGIETLDLSWFENSHRILKILGIERILTEMFAFVPLDQFALSVCEKLVDWPQLADAMRREYDLIIVEYFNSDCMLGLLHVYNVKAPILALSSNGMMPWTHDSFGINDNPSYVPVITQQYTSKMNFWERLENTFLQSFYKYWYRTEIQLKEQAMIEKHFGRRIPDLKDLAKNASLIMINTHHSLNGVRPLLPGVIEVGGMHLNHTKKAIPEFMERFISESEHGVLLLSFGSLIKTATMPQYKEEMIVNACSKLKQRVIWKYEESGEEGTLTGNILRVRWIPQFELLQHPKVIAFIAHGGLLGMTEAVYAGKPMVVVPFFGDQPNNAAMAQAAGLAKIVTYADLSEEALSEALEEVVSAQMRLKAKTVSQMWRDRIADPLDTAVYWTERVIRWGNRDPLISSARDLSFIELALLDVAAAFIVALVIVLLILRSLLSMIPKFLGFGSKKEKLH